MREPREDIQVLTEQSAGRANHGGSFASSDLVPQRGQRETVGLSLSQTSEISGA